MGVRGAWATPDSTVASRVTAVWLYPVVAAVLGVAAALGLRRRRYRLPDDEPGRPPALAWVPVLATLGTLAAGPFWVGQSAVLQSGYVVALVWGITLAVVDLEVRRLPDRLVLPAYPLAAVLLTVGAVVTGDVPALARAAAAAGAAVAIFLLLVLLSPGAQGLGLGDVKLAGVLGGLLGWFGWYPAVLGLALGFVLGGLVALVLLVLRRVRRGSTIPFGPAMILGAYLAGVVAPAL